jgi:uncharacterized protein
MNGRSESREPERGASRWDPELLKLLCCPETHQLLALASASTVEQLNQGIKEGRVLSRNGQPVRETMEAGLVRTDGRFIYPIRHGIPIMLVEESIPLESAGRA